MTAEEREKTQIKFYLSDEKVALLDSLNYHAQQAEKLGGKDLIQLEEDIKGFNKVVSTLSKEDLDEVKAALKSQAGEVVSETGTPSVQGVESADTKFKEFTGSRYDENAEIKIVKIENPLGREAQKDTAKIRNEILKPLIGQEVEIRSDGRIVGISNDGVRSSLKKRNLHRSVFTSLKEIITGSHYFDYAESDGKEKHKNVLGQFTYIVPVEIDGEVYRCEIKVDRTNISDVGEGAFKQQSVFKIADVALSRGRTTQGRSEAEEASSTTPATMKFADLMEGRKPNRPSVSFKADIRYSSSSALAPTQEMTRARVEKMNGLLSRITKTAGIKIVRESSEQIRKSAEKAQAGRDKIENNLRSLSSNGIIYGYFDPVRRELHLNSDFADFDTPIHEWTHVWWAWLKGEDPRLIERIVELMKQTKEYQRFRMEAMTDKKSVYHGLSEEELAEEVFARLTGKRGESKNTRSVRERVFLFFF